MNERERAIEPDKIEFLQCFLLQVELIKTSKFGTSYSFIR